MNLPIDPLLPRIVASLQAERRLVLRADPGAGKTTRVPTALLDAGLAGDKQILVLEPRRIAARSAAEFVSRERGQNVGGEVGYRVRYEHCGGPSTRLWFVTEGIFGRHLGKDPFLEQVGIVVLDEFHERHLPGDLALGIVRELQETVRPDLLLVVMSATLEAERVASFLGDCPVVASTGRSYPVAVEFVPPRDPSGGFAGRSARVPPITHTVDVIEQTLRRSDDDGDILVFLPGAAEIHRVGQQLSERLGRQPIVVVPLHGDLPLDEQQRAIHRAPRRKVVLSTNVAETALTIEGVTTVIDTGLVREARLDRTHGINGLQTVRISRAAAEQRCGRAGRTAPGRCIRLWSLDDHHGRRAYETPEVLRLDLSAAVLALRAWGLHHTAAFRWLDPPSAAALAQAEQLLRLLGAVDARGTLTAIGERMLALGAEPRLARVLVEAVERGIPATGALVAALAAERDMIREQRAFGGDAAAQWESGPSDLLLRAELFEAARRARFDRRECERLGLEPRTVRAVDRARLHYQRLLRGAGSDRRDAEGLLRCVLAGFPDRVVRRREAGSPRGRMVGGTGVVLDPASVVRDDELFVAVHLQSGRRGERTEAVVRLASAVQRRWLVEMCGEAIREEVTLVLDVDRQRVVRRRRRYYADLVLDETVDVDVDPAAAGEILAAAARTSPRSIVAMNDDVELLLARLEFLRRALPEDDWPADDEGLLADAAANLCRGCSTLAQVRRGNLLDALRQVLGYSCYQRLAREAPAHLILPSGRQVAIGYEPDRPPHVAARIQEVFGLTMTPRVARGRIPITLELLAPNQRPAQITDDLASFWKNTYPEVRKVLRGRYPKHPWPEDPLNAPPTSRARPRPAAGAR